MEGKSFFEMNESEIRYSADQIMLRGAAISGCALPQTEFFAKFIADEITIFLNDFGYSEYTLDEILLALRFNAEGSSFWEVDEGERIEFMGVSFNLVYLSKVMKTYSKIRHIMERKLQNIIDGYE